MRNRRALSGMVGAVFFIIAMTVAIGYISYSMDTLDEFAQTVIVKAAVKESQSNEKFDVNKVTIENNAFDITVTNMGQIPIKITRLWVENVTSGVSPTDAIPKSCSIQKQLGPQQSTIINTQSCPTITASDTASYQMKFVTERGTIDEFSVTFGGSEPLYMQLHASPTKISSKFTTTLIYEVINNMTGDTVLTNVTPKIKETATNGAAWQRVTGPTPTSVDFLEKGDTALFKWVYTITGNEGADVEFEASLENGFQDNNATASVGLLSVLLAKQSLTSLDSEGLVCCISSEELFIFHNENADTPGGYYQMDNRNAEITGSTVTFDSVNNNVAFITANDTTAKTIAPGNWDVSLRYFSAPVPVSLLSNLPDVIYHFESNSSPEDDSGLNNADMTLGDSGCSAPTWGESDGRHGTGAYHFTNDHCMNAADVSNVNDIGAASDSTAGWFKLDGTTGTRTIYSVGGTIHYKIFVDTNNKLVFEYQTTNNQSTRTTCTGTTILNAGEWYHFVASRPGGHTCELYLNGIDDNPTKVIGTGNDVTVNTSGGAFIGSLDDDGNDYFIGWIDDIIHWNDYSLTLAQSADLNNTNYGTDAHKIHFKTQRTDLNGVVLEVINQTSNVVTLQFEDGKESTLFTLPYNQFNYTFTTTGIINFAAQDRIGVNMTYDSGLGVDLRIDDSTIFGGQVSFLQTPDVDPFFSSYWVYDTNNDLTFSFKNDGSVGFWIQYSSSRISFEDVFNQNGYASVPMHVSGSGVTIVSPDRDSVFINIGQIADLTFKIPDKKPMNTSHSEELIPAGLYYMNTLIAGYDTVGGAVYKNFNLGIVKVI